MGPVPHRIFCSWYIDKAWRQNLNKIIGTQCKEKQSTVYKSLKMLQTISSDTEFKKILNKCIIEMMNDPETKDFGIYFEQMYANRATSWAYCYGKGLGVNCNMHLESMHKTIKYHYLNGCKIGRLDKSIMTIRRFTRDKKVERMIKLTKSKLTTRIQDFVAVQDVEDHFRGVWPPSTYDIEIFPRVDGRAPVPMGPFQCADVSKRLGKFENTAPGDDGLTYRHWKRLDPECTILKEVINVCLRYIMVPPAWKKAVTVLIYKEGAKEDLSNWRPISLSRTLYKVYVGGRYPTRSSAPARRDSSQRRHVRARPHT